MKDIVKKNFKMLLLAIVVIGILVYSQFFSKSPEETSIEEEVVELPVVTVAIPPSSAIEMAADVIEKNGYDEEEGVDLQFKLLDPGDQVLSILSDSVDIGQVNPILVATLRDEGKPLRIFSPNVKVTSPYLVLADSNIDSINQLKGERFGTPGKTSGVYTIFNKVFQKNGIDIEDNFEIVSTSLPSLPPLLLSKDVSGICIESILLTSKLLATGNVVSIGSVHKDLQDIYGEGFEMILAGSTAKESWLNDHKNEAKAWINAKEKAFQYLKENPEYYNTEEFKNKYEFSDAQVEGLKMIIAEYDYYTLKPWSEIIPDVKTIIQDTTDLETPIDDVFAEL